MKLAIPELVIGITMSLPACEMFVEFIDQCVDELNPPSGHVSTPDEFHDTDDAFQDENAACKLKKRLVRLVIDPDDDERNNSIATIVDISKEERLNFRSVRNSPNSDLPTTNPSLTVDEISS